MGLEGASPFAKPFAKYINILIVPVGTDRRRLILQMPDATKQDDSHEQNTFLHISSIEIVPGSLGPATI
jgi:hypothetical protein